jgi:hypothetical protein
MARCSCKTQKGVQCKKDAMPGSKTCSIHKKCKSKVVAKKVAARPKTAVRKVSKKVTKKGSPQWMESKLFKPRSASSPTWLDIDTKIAKKIKKPISPQNADPWWLR